MKTNHLRTTRQLLPGLLISLFLICAVHVSASAKAISECSVSLSQSTYTYTGATFSPTVTVKDGDSVLKENTDYTLYGNSAYTTGEHEITIAGQGDYSGRTTVSFTIEKAENKISINQKSFGTYSQKNTYTLSCMVKGNASLTYSTKTDGVSITKSGVLTAEEGFLGTAKIKVTAAETDSYKETTATFSVRLYLLGTKITEVKSVGVFEDVLPDNNHTASVYWEGADESGEYHYISYVDGFQIRYSSDSSFKNNVYYTKVPMLDTPWGIVSSCTMSKHLVKGTRFYFQIRSYKKALDGKTRYSEWSDTVSHKVDSSAKAFYKGKTPKNGKTYTVSGVKYRYQDGELTATGCTYLSSNTLLIPNKVSIYGVKYPVTAIKANAFSASKLSSTLKKVTIGKNVTSIGAKAFADNYYIDTIVIKSTKLKSGSIAKNAFRNVGRYSITLFGTTYTYTCNISIQVPASKKASYKKLFSMTGIKGTLIWV